MGSPLQGQSSQETPSIPLGSASQLLSASNPSDPQHPPPGLTSQNHCFRPIYPSADSNGYLAIVPWQMGIFQVGYVEFDFPMVHVQVELTSSVIWEAGIEKTSKGYLNPQLLLGMSTGTHSHRAGQRET